MVSAIDFAAFAGLALLAAMAPFERTAPLVRLPAQSVSNVEAIAGLAVLLAALALARGRGAAWRTRLTAPWVAFVAACAAAAILSPVSRVNALHMTGRVAAALAVFLATARAAATERRRQLLQLLLLGGGLVAAIFAILEYLGVPRILDVLTAFRPGVATVGAQVRAGGSLQYPTIASMYLEVVFALGAGLLLAALDAGARGRAIALWIALLLVGEAIVVTFTRAGLVTTAVTLAVAARSRAVPAAALAVALASLVVASRSADSLWLRFTSEGQEAWYRAAIEAPAQISLDAGDVRVVPVSATNTGRLAWDSQAEPPFYFSYHWLSAAGDRVVAFDGLRTAFETPVAPGETAVLPAAVRAPRQPGEYRLVWDVVQEGRLWLTTEPGAEAAISRATVTGGRSGAAIRTTPLPKPTVRPGRLALWRAAAAMFASHPIFGVGLDNFRLAYGRYAGLASADPRTHSNNMYLEVLAGAGLVGAGAFAWLLWSAACVVRGAGVGLVCAALAIAIHGGVDSFLGFAPTYVLFAITLGLACASTRGAEIPTDAHRV